jgi:hypothetical protein
MHDAVDSTEAPGRIAGPWTIATMLLFRILNALVLGCSSVAQPMQTIASGLDMDEKLIVETVLADRVGMDYLGLQGSTRVSSETEWFSGFLSGDLTRSRYGISLEVLDDANSRNVSRGSLRGVTLPPGFSLGSRSKVAIERIVAGSRPGISRDRRHTIVAVLSYYYYYDQGIRSGISCAPRKTRRQVARREARSVGDSMNPRVA